MISRINIKLLLFFGKDFLENHGAVFDPLLFCDVASVNGSEHFGVFLAAFVLGSHGFLGLRFISGTRWSQERFRA